jgi:hypothetical protein
MTTKPQAAAKLHYDVMVLQKATTVRLKRDEDSSCSGAFSRV